MMRHKKLLYITVILLGMLSDLSSFSRDASGDQKTIAGRTWKEENCNMGFAIYGGHFYQYEDVNALSLTFSGTIVNTPDLADNAGYITVKLATIGIKPAGRDKYTVVRWKNNTGNSVSETYAKDDAGKLLLASSKEEAENEFTEESGFLSHYCCQTDYFFNSKTKFFGNDLSADKFPGEFSFFFTSGAGCDLKNDKVEESFYNNPQGALYNKEIIGAGLRFPIGIYSIRPWIKDEVLIAGNSLFPGTSPNSYLRNRAFAGIDNYLTIDRIINIGLNFVSRFDTRVYFTNTTDKAVQNDNKLKMRFSPGLDLNGSYDIGLSWGIFQSFDFNVFPGTDLVFVSFDADGSYNLGFEIFHFFTKRNLKCKIYNELNFDLNVARDETIKPFISGDYFAGLDFTFYDFLPGIGYFITFQGDYDANQTVYSGLKFCLDFSRDWFSFDITYVGLYKTNPPPVDKYDKRYWENHFEASITMKIPSVQSGGQSPNGGRASSGTPACCRKK
jgi:hypothetical protein